MTNLNTEGLRIPDQDLSVVSPSPDDDNRLYNHDGSSSITLTDGTTTTDKGFYLWDEAQGAWLPMGKNADRVDGYQGSELAVLAENETITGAWTFGNTVDMGGNSINNRTGFLSSYLSTTQTTAETGQRANVFENLEVNDGPYTKNSASKVTVGKAGRYKLTWETGFKQVAGASRATMQSHPVINGTGRQGFRAYCYIRNDTSGSRSSCGNEAVFSLASGDTLGVWTTELTATGNDHDLRHASATIEYLG